MSRTHPVPRSAALIVAAVAVAAGAGAWAWLQYLGPAARAEESLALIGRYCVDCHNDVDRAGELVLDGRNLAAIGEDAEVWERVVRKLNTGMMPPAGEPRPPREDLDGLAALLESRLDRAAEDRPIESPAVLRRLNRTEYANAVRDLLDLSIDASALLPLDDSSEGFDNIAMALGTSPSLAEAYIAAAMKLSRAAIGDRSAQQTQVAYNVPEGLKQDRHLEGMPLGTRGGIRFEHQFPLDAEYEFRLGRGFGGGGGGGGQVDFTIDGTPVSVGRGGAIRIPVSAGPHTITVASVETRRSAGVDDVYSAPAPTGGIRGVEIDGPLNPTGVGTTPSRRRLLSCVPEVPAEEPACASEIVTTVATRAFRRPLAATDLPELMRFYEAGRATGSFEDGIQQALARILVDPRFLFRLENDPPGLAAGTAHPVDDYELATRLSFFLWSSIPDDALLEAATGGQLREPATLAAEVGRMLADPKADALVHNFAAQWLRLRELESVTPDADAFDENLRASMARESELLFGTVLREDLSVLTLLDADFTFVDERLARHYRIDGIRGSHFRRIELPAASPRRGLLGQASILTLTSVTNRTSPVIRGAWVLETLQGSPAPVPPPNVETTLAGDDGSEVAETVRERLEAHRADPVCASCHAIMDPIGFTLENFDLIGAWRDADGGQAIDSTAVLTDGTPVDGPDTLRAALLDRSGTFVATAAEKLMTYALGRRLEHYDMPAIRAIVRAAAGDNYRFSSLVQGIVASDAFRMRVAAEAE